MLYSSLLVLALSSSVFAVPYITSPTASTVFPAGQQATVTWQDDGQAPSLKDFGDCRISIYIGNAQQQTPKQLISQTNVGATNSVTFSPDPTIGENSNEYFIRIESINFKDPKNPQYPALAFSSKFTLSGMTGTFTAEEKKQIAGQTTAPLGGPTPSAQSPASSGSAATTKSPTSTSGARSPSASASGQGNSASTHAVSSKVIFGGLFAAVVALL